jgi:hypothetical protein
MVIRIIGVAIVSTAALLAGSGGADTGTPPHE